MYQRTGTLWEGRFKSCLIQEERYLLEVYRYIELNPIRAGMVDGLSEYSWSSYQCNGLGKESLLRVPHELYLSLGKAKEELLTNYLELFKVHISNHLIQNIRKCTNKGLALGDDRFKREIEKLTKQRVTARKIGRPKKVKNNVYDTKETLL